MVGEERLVVVSGLCVDEERMSLWLGMRDWEWLEIKLLVERI